MWLTLGPCAQMWAIWKVTWHLFVWALPFKLVNDAATFVGPIFLNLLLGVVSAGQSSTLGYSYAAVMFVGLVIGTLCDNQHFQRVMRAGIHALPLSVCHCMHACKLHASPAEALTVSTCCQDAGSSGTMMR